MAADLPSESVGPAAAASACAVDCLSSLASDTFEAVG